MVSRLHSWLRIGIIAASASVAACPWHPLRATARYGGNRRGGNPTCGNELWWAAIPPGRIGGPVGTVPAGALTAIRPRHVSQ